MKNYGFLVMARKAKNNSRAMLGFTLIEILMVIVIISILSGIALLRMTRNQQKQLGYFANSLSHSITLAEQEAMLQSVTLGLAFTATSFQFFHYQTKKKCHWQALTDKIYGLHYLPDNTQITLKIQNKIALLEGHPQIIIAMSGEVTPFTLLMGKKGQKPTYQIIGDENSKISSQLIHAE
jgi:general secretion pathway protein H